MNSEQVQCDCCLAVEDRRVSQEWLYLLVVAVYTLATSAFCFAYACILVVELQEYETAPLARLNSRTNGGI